MTNSLPNDAEPCKANLSITQKDSQPSSDLNKGSIMPKNLKLQTPGLESLNGSLPSSPTKGTKRSFSGDDDNPVDPHKRTRDRPRLSRRPTRKLSVSTDEGLTRIISKLFYTTTEFWLLVLGEQSWPFLFDPAPLTTTKSEDDPGPTSTGRNLHKRKTRSNSPERIALADNTNSAAELKPGATKDKKNSWDEVRTQLGEERDRLCMWKVGISDANLDGLLDSETEIYNQLGKVVLETLLRLAVSMSTAIDLQKTSENHGSGKSKLQETANKLDKFIKEGTKISCSKSSEHDSKSHDMIPALATSTQLLDKLKSDIGRLSKLSVQIKLAAADPT